METYRALVDELIEADRAVNTANAARLDAVDRLRRWNELMAAAEPPSPPGPRDWTTEARAGSELLFEVACALRLPERTAANLIADTQYLAEQLPATFTALRDGRISLQHVRVMTEQSVSLPPEGRAGFEEALLPLAEILTVSKFGGKVRKERERLHPESITERHERGLDERRVWLDHQPDGMSYLNSFLSAETTIAIHDRITSIAIDLKKVTCEERTLAQLRADVLSDLLLDGDLCAASAAAAVDVAEPGLGHGIVPKVLVAVPMLTLLGVDEAPARLDGYGPIDPDTARRLAAKAPSLQRMLTDPVTGVVLDFDRKKYVVPADLRMVLRMKDGTCVSVGCNRPAARCEVDHIHEWAEGGTTCLTNLCHECQPHHHRRHYTSVSVAALPNGDIEWTTKAGKKYIVEPELRLPQSLGYRNLMPDVRPDEPSGEPSDGSSGEEGTPMPF
jgi:hypothetical protein